MDSDQIKRLKAKARLVEPVVWIGKNGLTDTAVMQIKRLLTKRKLVKVKLLRSFLDTTPKKDAAEQLAKRTGAQLVDQVGFVVVLHKR